MAKKQKITDDLLRVTVAIRCEAGVTPSQVRELVENFAADERREPEDDDIVEYLWLPDVPLDRRGEFLAAVAALAPVPRGGAEDEPRLLSAANIWASRVRE